MKNQKAMMDFVNTYESPIITILVQAMNNSMEHFSAGDLQWIMDNQSVVAEFFNIADDERLKNRKSGSWLIANQVRWRTRAHENKGRYKMNNNHISLLSHAYNVCPARDGYFFVKGRKPLELPA